MTPPPETEDQRNGQKAWAHMLWYSYLTGDYSQLDARVRLVRQVFRHLPREPRCTVCRAPFSGLGGAAVSLLGFGAGQSRFSPRLCDRCEKIVKKHQVGMELQLTMLFADVRGSTTLAESIGPSAFHRLIDRFYKACTDVLVRTDALIDRLIGDQVIGLYVPGIAGPEYTQKALEAAWELLQVTGHSDADGPWIPVGAGVHTGTAYLGAVGSGQSMSDITVFGDAANIAARLASQAGPGEILVSQDACRHIRLNLEDRESRVLDLKGRSEPIRVRSIRVSAGGALARGMA